MTTVSIGEQEIEEEIETDATVKAKTSDQSPQLEEAKSRSTTDRVHCSLEIS